MIYRLLILILLIITIISNSFSQDIRKNVVYLKSGRIIAGTITEIIPDQYVKIVSTADVAYTILFTDILYIRNERMDYYSESTDTTVYAFGIRYSLFAGIAFPTDEFGDISHERSGYAKSGVIFGGEVNFPLIRSFYVNATISAINNSVDDESFRKNGIPSSITVKIENWNSYWFLPGLRWESKLENITLYAMLNCGWSKVESPVIFFSGNLSNAISISHSNTQTGYGFSIGGIAFEYFTFGFRYYYTKPQLPKNAMSTPEILKLPSNSPFFYSPPYYQQPVSIYSIIIGASF